MTETYPATTPQQTFAPQYGSGMLLPYPGSPRTANKNEAPGYEQYAGVQLLSKVALSAAVLERAGELGTTLHAQGNVLLFDPPTCSEVARQLGSLVNAHMHGR